MAHLFARFGNFLLGLGAGAGAGGWDWVKNCFWVWGWDWGWVPKIAALIPRTITRKPKSNPESPYKLHVRLQSFDRHQRQRGF